MVQNNRCLGCMEDKGGNIKCPNCDWIEGKQAISALHLPPGTILNEKYLLGKVLGQGGFGITYLSWDFNLNLKLAIKEYFPQELATRGTGQSMVSIHSGALYSQYEYGMEKFLQEARMLARFEEHPNIVSVRDFFRSNETAYLVMNYIEGITLKELIETHGPKLPVNQAVGIIMPVMDALKELHDVDVLHRDISPDNIYINKKGQVILIDFGAARQAISEQGRNLSIIIKPGYAPEEQYRSKGIQGPWTDIYSLSAMFYQMITGKLPPDSLDRLAEETLIPPSDQGVIIEPHQEQALLRALSVRASERYQSVNEFQNDLLYSSSYSVDNTEADIKYCPLCKGKVAIDATRCKHCKSEIVNLSIDPEVSKKEVFNSTSVETYKEEFSQDQALISIAKNISAGAKHSLIIKNNGDLYSFGLGWNGRLGQSDIKSRSKPEIIKELTEVQSASAGGTHSLVLFEDGSVYSFGSNNKGQLGLSDNKNRMKPNRVLIDSKAKAVSAGNYYSLVLLETGEVCSFGYGGNGQLGHGDNNSMAVPKKIENLNDVAAIAAGDSHSLVLLENGKVYSFGLGTSGQLGHGDLKNRSTPKLIESLSAVKAVAAGLAHSMVLLASGHVSSFGFGKHGRLGTGDVKEQLFPCGIETLPDAIAISAGYTHSLVLLSNGDVYSFGEGKDGLLGHGDRKTKKIPVKINTLMHTRSISAGAEHSLVLLDNGAVYSFGIGDFGRLGHDDTSNRLEPTIIHWL